MTTFIASFSVVFATITAYSTWLTVVHYRSVCQLRQLRASSAGREPPAERESRTTTHTTFRGKLL